MMQPSLGWAAPLFCKSTMKILYFTRSYNAHDHRFLSALAKTNHKIYYLTLEQGGRSLEERALPPQVEILSWSRPQVRVSLWDEPRLLWELKGLLRKVQPDLVQAGPIQRTALLTALAGFHPLLSMSWGYDLLIDAQRSANWRSATRYVLQHSDAFLGDCDTIRTLAVAYGMAPDRIVTFPWGVDLQHFAPPVANQKAESSSQTFTLLSTRSWEPIYGVDTLAQGFTLAARQCSELRLVMLGGGSLAGQVRQILSKTPPLEAGTLPDGSLAVYERVEYPGQAGFTELPRHYRSADLYVAATHSDGSSISLLEAMACGRPVLVSDIPGNREWVTPGENGWLFPAGDAPALAQAILHAYEQRDQLLEMGRKARQIVEQRANWEKNFPKLFQAYDLARKK